MKKGLTDITVIADRSGSMSTTRDEAISGFNEFVQGQKDAEGTATLTLALFDDIYHIEYSGKNIKDVQPLTTETFVPRGFTALYDAIGRTITAVGARLAELRESDRPEHVILFIITDGGENASKEYVGAKIREMITHQQSKYNWQFVFLGANQDAITTAATMGISRNSSMTYAGNSMGTKAAYASVTANLSSLRAGTMDSFSFTASDRQLQEDAGAK